MATALQEFRAQYPEYNHVDDEELAESLRQKYYTHLDPAEYRRQIGLPKVQAPPAPTIGERIDRRITEETRQQDPLKGRINIPQEFRDPDGFLIDTNRPQIVNPDGSISTESTLGVNFDGREYNIPTIVNGKRVSQEEAINDARRKMAEGWEFPNYATVEESEAGARRRSGSIRQARNQASGDTTVDSMMELARDYDGPLQTYFRDWEKSNDRGFLNNATRLAAERTTSLLGNAIQGIGRGGESLNEKWGAGQIVFGSDWGPDDPADGKFRVRYMNPREFDQFRQDNTVENILTDSLPLTLKSKDYGGMPRNTVERIKGAYARGEIMGTMGSVIKFGIEQGITSIPDMVAVLGGPASIAMYVNARSNEIGEIRAQHKGLAEATFQENLEALPFALGSALLERIGAGKIVSAFGTKKTAEQVGQELLESGYKAVAKRIASRTLAAAGTEAATEAFQEGVLEYLGETLGTDAPTSWRDAVERGFFGALGGATFGGTAGGTLALGGEATRAFDQQMIREMEEDFLADQGPDPEIIPDTDFDEEGNIVTVEPEDGPQPPPPVEPDPETAPAPDPAPEPAAELTKHTAFQAIEQMHRRTRSAESATAAAIESIAKIQAIADERGEAMGVWINNTTGGYSASPLAGNKSDPNVWTLAGVLQPDLNVPRETPETPADDSTTTVGDAEVFDPRLKREVYRVNLAGMADELVPGGGITLVPDPDSEGAFTGRTPTVNPEWFQRMNETPGYQMSVKQVQNAVRKVLNGEPLGVRQARVVATMLGEITGQRTDPAQIDYAQEQLTAARQARARARAGAAETLEDALAELEPYEAENAGELFEEQEYLPEMDAEARIVDELADRLDDFGDAVSERVAIILDGSSSTAEAMAALEVLLHEQLSVETGVEGTAAPTGAEPSAEVPPTAGAAPDFELEQEQDGAVAPPEPPAPPPDISPDLGIVGDLFSEDANRQMDLVDESRKKRDDQVESRRQAYNEQQLEMYLEQPPVETQAAAPRLDAAKSDAAIALENLRAAPSVLADASASELAQRQRTSLVGKTIESVADLAILAQIYRDVRMERLRVFFVDASGEVVSQVGLTVRMPASATGLVGDDMDAYLQELNTRARATGAVGFYLTHNHPSGQSRPSQPDIALTEKYMLKIPGFLGHVVTDSNEFSAITAKTLPDGNFRLHVQKHEFDMGDIPAIRTGPGAGRLINAPEDVMQIIREQMDVPDRGVTVIVANNSHRVLQVVSLDSNQITGTQAEVRRHLLRVAFASKGGNVMFAVGKNENELELVAGFMTDSLLVNEYGAITSFAATGRGGGLGLIPTRWIPRITPDTSIEFDYLRDQIKQQHIEARRRPAEAEGVAEPDRRKDLERRRRYENMPLDELIDLIHTDNLTGLGNQRSFEEMLPHAGAVGVVDADSLGGVNDNISHSAGDQLIKAIALALENTGAEVYRTGGDEFHILGDNPGQIAAHINKAKLELAHQVIEDPNGKLTGINITTGVGATKADADRVMELSKKERKAAGLRAPKGVLPKNGVVYTGGVLNAQAGSNHVGIIGRHGDLPINANKEYVLGNGEVVRIPKKPVRRRHIMGILERKFGVKIYQGRVKGKTRLGFYRPGHGEIRIKTHNDLEVTAHEVSHWLDDRHPWISQLYNKFASEMSEVSYDVDLLFEGYAEFMRTWFTQEHEARQSAPGFYDAWMEALESHPGIKDVAMELQQLMHAWHLQGARARLDDRYGKQDVSIADRVRDHLDKWQDRFLTAIFDGLRPFKEIERQIRGGLGAAAWSGYKSLRLARGAHATMETVFRHATINWDADGNIVLTGSGLKQVLGPQSHRMEDFLSYIVAMRAAELTDQGRENHIRIDEIQAGLRLGELDNQHKAELLAKDPEAEYVTLEDTFNELQAFNDRMMDFYQSSGILSQSSRAAIQEMNKNYVPFNRIIDRAAGESVKRGGGSPFMRLKGGTQDIADVMESIVGNTSHLVHMSLVNRGKENFYRMIDNADNQVAGLYAAPVGRDVKPTRIQRDQVLKTVVEGMGLSMSWYRMAKTGMVASDEEMALIMALDRMADGLGPMVTFWETGQDPKGDIDFYFDRGEKKFYEIIDKRLMEAIGQIGPQSHNLVVAILGGFANVLRRGVTLTPTFQVKNFIRDTMNAFTLSKGEIIPAASATKALLERLYNDEHYWEYMANGGGFASMADADGINRDRVLDTHKKVWDHLDSALSAFEYANRIAEFKTLRAKGWSAREAALAGREISSDFAMRGSAEWLRVLTISIPFLNARLQGLYRNGRELASMEEGRLQFAGKQAFSYALRSLISITIPSLVLYALNKDDERYQELPDWIRDLGWILFTGEDEDDYVIIPKPFETGMIWGTQPERMIEYYYKNDEKELADAMLWMVLETFNFDFVPQAFKVWQELAKNKNFTGAPIIPNYLENVEPSEQYRAYTSDAMIALGRKLNISPLKAEYIVRGHLGTLGVWALGAADMLVGDIANGGQAPTKRWQENVLMAPFFNAGPLRRTHSEGHLYEMLRETQRVVNTVRLVAARSPDRLEEYLSQPRKEILSALNEDLVGWSKNMREIKHAIDAVQVDPEMDGDEKTRQIDALERAQNEISHAVYQNINPELVQELLEEAESAAVRTRAVGGQ